MIHNSLKFIYSRATSFLSCFNVYIFGPYTFYFSYIMDRFLIKTAFGSEALIKRADAFKRKCGKAEMLRLV